MEKPLYHDITLPVSPHSVVFPGDPLVEIRVFARVAREGFNASALSASLHAGTHVDAPRHLWDELPGVDRLPLEALIGPVRVLDCRSEPVVGREFLERHWEEGTERLLLQTGGGEALRRGELGGGCLTGEGARFLVERRVRLVGIDALSIDALDAEELPAHRELLGGEIVVVEGVDLSSVEAGYYELICLPIRLQGGDGAPARVILIEK